MAIEVRDGVDGKVCATCKEWRPLDAFNRHSLSADGRQPRCRRCPMRACSRCGRTPATGFLPSGSQDLTLDLGIHLPPNLVLIKRAGSTTVAVGSIVTYTLTYLNQGPTLARSTLLTETVPSGATVKVTLVKAEPYHA